MKRCLLPILLLLAALSAGRPARAQTINLLYCDFFGAQPVEVDTMLSGGKANYLNRNAAKHFAVGLHIFGLSEKRKIHFGFLIAYRQIDMKNLNLVTGNNIRRYDKEWFAEMMFGPTYFSRHPFFQTNNLAGHFNLEALGGFQANEKFAFGANLAGGFFFLNKKTVTGLSLQFVYRPVPFEIDNRSEAFSPDPFYVKLAPSYSVRIGLCFGRGVDYQARES